MSIACPNSPSGRHNFPVPGGNCIFGCGTNQAILSGAMRPAVPRSPFERPSIPKAPPKGIHSELHELVAKMRRDFGETAKTGKGSFGFYLGILKRVPLFTIYRWLAEIKDSPNLTTPEARCKIFWWKYKQWSTGKSVS